MRVKKKTIPPTGKDSEQSTERIFPEDDLSQRIFDLHMDVVGASKTYFCIAFGHHDALDNAVEYFLEDGISSLPLLSEMLAFEIQLSDLAPGLGQTLRELVTRPLFGKAVTRAMLNCRYSLLLSCCFSVACFRKLEEDDKVLAISAYGKSEFYLAMCMAGREAAFGTSSISTLASMGALAKLASDPKQKEKILVRECWNAWQVRLTAYKSNAAFARDMLEKFETLKSQPVIERWCRDWKEESGTQPAK